ncbi:MAG: excinuclease ABC subunit UvrA [Chitinivibrionales bacterium]|nr:excinuclease ABC subunit UvrA [Chitinivibrionales bacterium]
MLDEPTTGLHFADIRKLLDVLHRLVDQGNTVVVVEHNLEVIKTADHIIDLGPEGGAGGGELVAQGTPEQIADNPASYTGQALRGLLRTSRRKRLAAVRKASAAPRARRRRRLEHVQVRGAREHNLRNVDVRIPREKLSVFSGPSGSGKSSLALDTIYAEGQRRYIGSLSAYARQFLGRLDKPAVDQVDGLSPAISIEQRATSHSPRSTVGTVTEIYDYLRALYARLGVQHCPECGVAVGAQASSQIIDRVAADFNGRTVALLAPVSLKDNEEYDDVLKRFATDGFRRVRLDGDIVELESMAGFDRRRRHTLELVVDRVKVSSRNRERLADSVEQALQRSGGWLMVSDFDSEDERRYSRFLSCPSCWNTFEPVVPKALSFNHIQGWCPACEGLGTQHGADLAVLVPFPRCSIRRGALGFWGSLEPGTPLRRMVEAIAKRVKGLDLDTPWNELPEAARQAVLYGTGDKWYEGDGFRFRFKGLVPTIEAAARMSPRVRKQVEHVARDVACTQCGGGRLNPVSSAVKLRDVSLPALCALPLEQAQTFLEGLRLDERESTLAGELLDELRRRLRFLVDVGLEYVTLGRAAATLSGGESQRIRLAAQIGSGLTGVLYVLDEPTIGLHPRDNARLLKALGDLRDLGNTLVVVEHDRDTLEAADHLVDFGPGAGPHGGSIVAAGAAPVLMRRRKSLTGRYLAGKLTIPVLSERRAPLSGPPGDTAKPEVNCPGWLTVVGAQEHNLANITVHVPLGVFVAVTGPSGSGKSTLINDILHNHLARVLNGAQTVPGSHDRVLGARQLRKVITIDQTPLGHGARSDPSTYTGVFDRIRELYSLLPEACIRGYNKRRFSYNHKGGRCEACWGLGKRRIEMHFLPDVWVDCDACHGARFNRETLEVKYRGRSIADVLAMPIENAYRLFARQPKIARILGALIDVGLGYMQLGQPASTLSGGEAQRVKLARELARPGYGQTIYLLDEPTTGLHVSDVQRLLAVLHRLADSGNTVLVIEHNMEVVKSADWVIDLGPGGGEHGGTVVAAGTPEEVSRCGRSSTAPFLREALERSPRVERAALLGDCARPPVGQIPDDMVDATVRPPWEEDGDVWHTGDDDGPRPHWDSQLLLALIRSVEKLHRRMTTEWKQREVVCVGVVGETKPFLTVSTSTLCWLEALLWVRPGAFTNDELNEMCPLPSWDDVEGAGLRGSSPRIYIDDLGQFWHAVTVALWSHEDIENPGFKQLLKRCFRSYAEGCLLERRAQKGAVSV